MRKTLACEHGRHGAVVLYNEDDIIDSPEPDKDTEPVAYDNLVPAMEAAA
jgi:hypothetical protein